MSVPAKETAIIAGVAFALGKAGSVQPSGHMTVGWDVDAVVTAECRFINT